MSREAAPRTGEPLGLHSVPGRQKAPAGCVLQARPRSASGSARKGVGVRAGLAAGLLGAAALLAPACGAEDSTSWAYELSHQLMSPFCPGRTLPDCPSPQAAELQRWIREQEQIGRTRGDVEAELVAQFGDVILQSPRARGYGLAAYLVPVVLFLSGGSLLAYFLRRETRASAPAAPPSGGLRPVDPELEQRLEAELRESDPDR